ncbi:MAG TPA: hypothetical protein VK503_05165, partial [Candidatus Bathyarchaeia archaeon]|nr:hypothetical protein [Candidatus Bathyarchaeia archaeon]
MTPKLHHRRVYSNGAGGSNYFESGNDLAQYLSRTGGGSASNHLICSSDSSEDVYATIGRGRTGQGSLPCSRPPQS